jgi:ribonuclease HI
MNLPHEVSRIFDLTYFDPEYDDQDLDIFDPSSMIFCDPSRGTSGLPRYRLPHPESGPGINGRAARTIFVSIHGACRGNGTEVAKGAYGVHFGKGSRYNQCGLVPGKERQGSNAAAVYAAIRALEIVEDSVLRLNAIENVILKTHSAYLSKGLTEHVWGWKENGYQTWEGQDVQNRFLVEKLHHMIEEGNGERGFKTYFWLVNERDNYDAVFLANDAYNTTIQKKRSTDRFDNPFARRVKYWMYTAPTNLEAQQLCQRLGIAMHNPATSGFTGLAAPIRRLVVTGEDRQENFERLFGSGPIGNEGPLYWKIRLQVVGEPWFPPDPQGPFLDEGAPCYRPRQLSDRELWSIKKKGKQFSGDLDRQIQGKLSSSVYFKDKN